MLCCDNMLVSFVFYSW